MRVKEILKQQGKTAKDLAQELGMTETGLSLALSDKGNPSLKTLTKIAECLNVHISELFDNEGSTAELTCPHCGNKISIRIRK